MLCIGLIHSANVYAYCSKIISFDLKSNDGFMLKDCRIVYDSDDFTVVKRFAQLLSEDVEKVTGFKIQVSDTINDERVILLGTYGRNKLIDKLAAEGKIDVSSLTNGWEQFIIKCVDNPFKGVGQALVIAGSDRRGTAYGAVTISEQMGVSPWYWWADVPVVKHKEVYVVSDYVSKKPSVKYRGIFINDEDWGLKPWASKNYDKKLGDIGPSTYEKVCELIIRLKGNMLAPAMHTCTGAFYSYPENKLVADNYGVIITTSHCEPLLFNNASPTEWNKARDGEWDYNKNKDVIYAKMNNRVKEAAEYENIYTVAMRGIHDEGMRGGQSVDEKVKTLERVIADQREILENNIGKNAEEIPQIFVPYKETLGLYEHGLNVPDDVTIVWPDDNFGYMKRLSSPDERKRKGGSGVYYHLSYLGVPHDYLWLCTTPPVLMYEELKKAYNTGADRYWLLNVGDIKPMELGIQTFMAMAWDIDAFDYKMADEYQNLFLGSILGKKFKNDLNFILDEYYRLAWSRKPEFMGWERQWDAPGLGELKSTDYSFENYNDAQQRLYDYRKISDMCKSLMNSLPNEYKPSFYEIIGYPVMASYQMNRKFLLAQYNMEKYSEGCFDVSNWAAKEARAAYDSINILTDRYNSLLNGKWRYMMDVPKGFVAKYQEMPGVIYKEGYGEKSIELEPSSEGYIMNKCMVIDLKNYSRMSTPVSEIKPVIIEGLGYEGAVLQMGEATSDYIPSDNIPGAVVSYELPKIDSDSIRIIVYTLPLFPLHEGKSTEFGLSVDDGECIVLQNNPKEFSKRWKDDVLRNGTCFDVRVSVNPDSEKHCLDLICKSPGVMIQKIIVDWGGLKESYIGPSGTTNDL